MNPILLILQQPTSETGRVGQLLQAQGYSLDLRCPSSGDPLPPTLEEHEAAVIFGGPMSANDDQILPFIRAELDWIPIALASGKPFLGICLGGQLLARVLGATVAPHPEAITEIGYIPVVPTAAGENPLTDGLHFYHWNREGFELPAGAVLLASGQQFPHQAFRYGDRAYGLQFHPEITAAMIDRWTTAGAEQLQVPGAQSRDQQFQLHSQYADATQNWLAGFLTRWLQQAAPAISS